MEWLKGPSLIVATIATGLLTGVWYAWAVSVMPGLARTDDRTYIDALQGMNRAIQNGWFFLTFMGSLLFIAAALLFQFTGDGSRKAVLWIVIGLVAHIVVLVITFAGNIPINNALDTAGPIDQMTNAAELRARFEGTWVGLNIARLFVNLAGFGSLIWGVVQWARS
jgi:uncharacterized membrane protein